MAATVAEISGGRFVLGLGAGWNETEYSAFGLPYDHRVTRFEESFEIVRRTLAGERVTLHGRFWQVDDLVVLPPAGAADSADDRLERPADAGADAAARRPLEHLVRPLREHGRGVRGAERVRDRAGGGGRPRSCVALPQTAVLVELDPDAAKRPHSDIRKQSDPVAPDLSAPISPRSRRQARTRRS